jgi:hypothetical protein
MRHESWEARLEEIERHLFRTESEPRSTARALP